MEKYDRNKEMQIYKTEEEQLKAINEYPYNISYIKNPTEKVQLAAVNTNGYTIRCIRNPSEETQLAAVKQEGSLIRLIENPTEKVIRTSILNGATKKDLMRIQNIDWNKISDELWLQIQLM